MNTPAVMKFKMIMSSLFQPQNTFIVQKSMRHSHSNSKQQHGHGGGKTGDQSNSSSSNNSDGGCSSPSSSSQYSCDDTASAIMNCGNSSSNSDDYRLKREKNNESVRKSRAKNRMALTQCASHVQKLQSDNVKLNSHLEKLQSELFTLKSLFQHSMLFNKQANNVAKTSEVTTESLYRFVMKKEKELLGSEGPQIPKTASATITASPAV